MTIDPYGEEGIGGNVRHYGHGGEQMTERDYTITDPNDALYNGDADHPTIDARFEWSIRNWPELTKARLRRHRRERQELAARHAHERRVNAPR